jgi:hypothetical protein
MSEYGGSRGTSLEAENLETDRGTHGLPEGKYEEKDKGDMEEKKRVLALALFKRRR